MAINELTDIFSGVLLTASVVAAVVSVLVSGLIRIISESLHAYREYKLSFYRGFVERRVKAYSDLYGFFHKVRYVSPHNDKKIHTVLQASEVDVVIQKLNNAVDDAACLSRPMDAIVRDFYALLHPLNNASDQKKEQYLSDHQKEISGLIHRLLNRYGKDYPNLHKVKKFWRFRFPGKFISALLVFSEKLMFWR